LAAVAVPAFEKQIAQAKLQARASESEPAQPATAAAPEAVVGDRFHWTMRAPGAKWQLLDPAVARKQNPLADRWLTRPDVDAHLLVLAETLPVTIDYDRFVKVVVENGKKGNRSFRVVHQGAIGGGRYLEAYTREKGTKLEFRYALRLVGRDAYQVMAVTHEDKTHAIESEVMTALTSFEPTALAEH
jgi:hypothetical protein